MTMDECEDAARRCAMGLPPSDFGSTRAIQAFAHTLRAAILAEREACHRDVTAVAYPEWDDDVPRHHRDAFEQCANLIDIRIRKRT